jgi:hypothetical protein
MGEVLTTSKIFLKTSRTRSPKLSLRTFIIVVDIAKYKNKQQIKGRKKKNSLKQKITENLEELHVHNTLKKKTKKL